MIFLKTNEEDFKKLSYLGFNGSFFKEDESYFVKIEKELDFPQVGKISEEQFFKVLNNSEKVDFIDDNLLIEKFSEFKPYGFVGNFSYTEKLKKMLKPIK